MVELLSGFPLFIQQSNALVKKNFILTKRSKRSAALQFFTPFIFLFLLFVLQKGEKVASTLGTILGGKVIDPPALVNPGIPACDGKFLLRPPCFDFVWSGSGSPKVENIVSAIMRNNPGRPISQDRVKSFRTPEEVDEWFSRNPMRCPSALHFVERNSTVISYGIQANTSTMLRKGVSESTKYLLQIPLQAAAEREIARSLLGDPNFSWTAGLKEFAHPVEKPDSPLNSFGPTLFNAMAMFGFVFQIGALVVEKELKLRQAMSMMGLYESAYWLSWLTWEAMLMLVTSLLTVLFGMMFQFDFFLHNNFAILFLVFFLFQLSMVGFAFLLSTLISKSTAANAVGFSVFIISVIFQMFDVYQMGFSKFVQRLLSLFPPIPFKQALDVLLKATSSPEEKGISWSERKECEDCTITIDNVFKIFISTFFLWFILAIYLDNIIPNSNGVRKPVYYFLTLSYWMGTGGVEVKDTSVPSLKDVAPDDEDVLAEETAVKEQASRFETDPDIAVQIRGLRKTYCRTICGVTRSAPYHAVKGLWVNLPKNQLFCLLGPNGAGKTTVISCLTGITPVTGGDASIYGHSVRNSVGMSNIRKIMGVCPQFDILWDALSGREHLHLFSSIKGLPPSSIKAAVEKSLDEVKLGTAAQVRAGSYSGGMKRRLSVAIALIGDPKLVFLDEPSTGMDPISRRHVWDIIETAKKGRAIVLTTHSMEEADILSDRIAIMAKGKLRCIGTSLRLKSRFGAGYVATVSLSGGGDTETSKDQAVPVKQFFKNHLDVEPKEENDKFLTFVIPRQKESLLPDFFTDLQDKEEELGISDIQISLTTLEEVFLNIAHQAELESSTAEGSLVTLDLSFGGSIQIPKGARFVGIPGTASPEAPRGRMVEVYWEHDAGDIVISGHSDETAIPETVQFTDPPVYNGGVPLGFVIDPRQLGKSH